MTSNGYDDAWVSAINGVMEDRGAKVRIVDLDDALWERFIGPLCDAIEDTEGRPAAPFAHLTTEYRGMESDGAAWGTFLDYEMFSESGNLAVARMVDQIISDGMDGKLLRPQLEETAEGRMKVIAEKHGEVWDTAVREVIWGQIDRRLCIPQGWKETWT